MIVSTSVVELVMIVVSMFEIALTLPMLVVMSLMYVVTLASILEINWPLPPGRQFAKLEVVVPKASKITSSIMVEDGWSAHHLLKCSTG